MAEQKAQAAKKAEAAKAQKTQKMIATKQEKERKEKVKQLQDGKKLASKTIELLTGARTLVKTMLEAIDKKGVALNAGVKAEKEAAIMKSEEVIGKAMATLEQGVVDDSYRLSDVMESKKALERALASVLKLS